MRVGGEKVNDVNDFRRLFWGEQAPLVAIGRGGRYFFARAGEFRPVAVRALCFALVDASVAPVAAAKPDPDEDKLPERKSVVPTRAPDAQSGAAGAAPASRRPLGCPAATLGIVCALALLSAFLVAQCRQGTVDSTKAAADAADRLVQRTLAALQDAFHHVFQPRVTVDNHVVFEQTARVLELVVVQRDTTVERERNDTRLGSSKRVRLRGDFHVKAGFDLQTPFSAQLERSTGAGAASRGELPVLRVTLPKARILSVESKKIDVLELKNGIWNRVQPGELAEDINALTDQARLKAEEANLAREAESALTAQLRERLGNDCRLEIQFGDAPRPPTGADPAR